MKGQMYHFNREIKTVRKNQMEKFDRLNTVTKIKSAFNILQ